MDTDQTQICRFCFTTKNHHISIFAESQWNVAEIISKHIGEVSPFDALPKTVCIDCWTTTEIFHKFHRSVKMAQTNYLKDFVKYELTELEFQQSFCNQFEDVKPPNFVEVIPNDTGFDDSNRELVSTKCDKFDIALQSATGKKLRNVSIECVPKVLKHLENEDNPLNSCDDKPEKDSDQFSESEYKASDSIEANRLFVQNFDLSCDMCNINLKTLNRAILHYKEVHGITGGYIKCCGLKFAEQHLVDDHIQWHINPDIFKCEQCDKILKSRKSLAKHVTDHKHMRTFICDYCDKVYMHKGHVKRHLFTHLNLVQCKLCPKRCSTQEKLKTHEQLIHHPSMENDVRTKLEALKNINPKKLSVADTELFIAKHFDMTCDECGNNLKSLQQAQFHYMHEHKISDGYIKCCDVKLKKNKNLNGHIQWHMNPEIFKCNICGKMKKTVHSLRVHLKLHITKPATKKDVCEECGKAFFRKHALKKHLLAMHGIVWPPNMSITSSMGSERATESHSNSPDPSIIKYTHFDMTCDVCSSTLDSLQHAQMHYMDEHGIPDGYIKCCNIKFKEIIHIKDHLQFHLNPDIFKCALCDKTFPKRDILRSHVYRHRVQLSKQFTCSVCNKVFLSKRNLTQHGLKHEKQNKPQKRATTIKSIPCAFCNRLFSTEKLQKDHEERIHQRSEQVKSEICEFCAKPFSSRTSVLSHIRSKHTENVKPPSEQAQCKICDAWLSNRYKLKSHILRHTSDPQKCPKCEKVSPNQHALLCHIRDVHTERIHKCHLCGKSFKAAVALKDHVATHTGEKLYKCSYCPESFIWRPNCYSHQKKVHPDEWNQSRTRKKTIIKLKDLT